MRVFGLSGSGMDIDHIVSDLMRAERARALNKLEKKKQTSLWKQEMYQDINRDLAKFIIDTKEKLGLSGSTSSGRTTYDRSYENMDWVKRVLSTDTDVATGTATSQALNGNYKLVVHQLAEGISKASTAAIGSRSGTDENDKLSDQFEDIVDTDEIKFTITTDIGSKSFTFNGTQTLDDIISEVNTAKIGDKKLGIKMSYDADIDRFFINSTETGSDVSLKIEDNDSTINGVTGASSQFFSDILKIDIDDDSTHDGDGVETLTGKDLEFDFGDAVGLTKTSNTFSINGINITAKDLGTTTINVETDVDGVYDKIKEFVNEYNKLIGEINTKLYEKVYRDYEPLTDEEKDTLSESEIEKWEDKAKSGLFKNDSRLSEMISDIRLGLYDVVEDMSGSFNHLVQIGITTGEYSDKGKLVIDDSILKDAISDDAGGIMELLFKKSKSDDEETKYKESGLVMRMFDSMEKGIKNIIDKSGPGNDETLLKQVDAAILGDFVSGVNLENGSISMISEDIFDLNDEIYDEERRLFMLENRYYSKYAAMESALSRMNSQSSWFASQLGGF